MHSEKTCDELAGLWTDAKGRFSFTTHAVYQLPSAEQCPPVRCIADPGWTYWFVVETPERRVQFWNGGLGYGPTRVRVVCELVEARSRRRGDELNCPTIEHR